ncbi:L-arabinose transport system permease protein AraP [compost metagenome]
MVVIVLIFVWKTMGYNMILFTAGLSSVPENLVEAARLDGASERYIFLSIKLRYLSPVIFFVVLYAVICSFKIFREVYMLVGNYPADGLYMLQNFINNTFQSGAYPKLSSAAVWQATGMIVVIGLLFGLERKFGKEVED